MSIRAIVASIAALGMLAACSSSKSDSTPGNSSAPAGGSSSPAAATKTIKADGDRLVGPNGHTIYANTVDTMTTIKCVGGCAAEWPPLIGTGAAGAGVDASKLGTAMRPDGSMQITYNGHPLYYFDEDKDGEDQYGKGIADEGGKWGVAQPSGALDTSGSGGGTSTAEPSESESSSGYTY